MLLQRKIGKYLAKLESSNKTKDPKVKKGSKCYVKLIKTWGTWVTLVVVTIAIIISAFLHMYYSREQQFTSSRLVILN